MNWLKDAFEHLIQVGRDDKSASLVEEINGILYWRKDRSLVMPPEYPVMQLHSLSGLVDFIAHSDEAIALRTQPDVSKPMVVVRNCARVEFVGGADTFHGDRQEHAVASDSPRPHTVSGRWYPHEEFMIVAAQHFSEDGDFDRVMRYLQGVKDSASIKTEDDGVSQSATVRRGVESLSQEKFVNPAGLYPYTTFAEVAQPRRNYILRMKGDAKGGLGVALFEIDDGKAEIQAVTTIKEYLVSQFKNLGVTVQVIG